MPKKLYEILGLEETASPEQIKKQYRKLALENHPDRHPNDKVKEELFKAISNAYAILIDEEKRKQYDADLIDEMGNMKVPNYTMPDPADLASLKKKLGIFESLIMQMSEKTTPKDKDYKNKQRLFTTAAGMVRYINELLDPKKPLDRKGLEGLNKALDFSIYAVQAIIENKPEEVKRNVIALAQLSKTVSGKGSPGLQAWGVSLMVLGGLALVAAGFTAAAIFAIPTFGGSLVLAAELTISGVVLGTAGAVVAIRAREKGMAKHVHQVSNSLRYSMFHDSGETPGETEEPKDQKPFSPPGFGA